MRSMYLILTLVFLSEHSFGHARWALTGGTVVPRNNSTGLKSAPCGGIARTASSRAFTSGQTINVSWEETVNHPGRYEIYFSQSGDSNFTLLKTINDSLNDNAVPHAYSTQITLPNVVCTDCTLQLVQFMTDSNSYYYSCADIQLNGGTPPPPPNPGPSPSPTCP